MGQGSFTPVTADASAVLGQFAALLADDRPLADALRVLSTGLELRSAVVRSAEGRVLGVGGEALQAVAPVRAVDQQDVWLEFPVGTSGTLTIRGGRPSQLPALRSAASILDLALSARRDPAVSVTDLVIDGDQALDEVADAIHDGPLQSLLVARYAIDAADRGGDPRAVRAAVQQAAVELRQLVWSLRPRGDSSLSVALHELSTSLVKADQLPLELELGNADVTGPPAALAYRLVQAIRAVSVDQPVRLRLDGAALDIFGAALPAPQRWVRRAAALGCVLSTAPGQTRLVLAATDLSSSRTDVRTRS